jgi:hypothetical protein
MRISIFVGFTIEMTSLHHRDQCELKLKVSVRFDDVRTSGYISSRRGRKVTMVLLAMTMLGRKEGN